MATAPVSFYNVLLFLIPVISLALVTPVFISMLMQFYCVEQEFETMPIHKHFKYAAITAFIFSIGFIIMDLLYVIFFWIETAQKWTNNVSNIIFPIRIVMIIITIYSVYTILLLRLYHTFQESIFQIRKCHLVLHAINFVISMAVAIFITAFSATMTDFEYPFVPFLVWLISLTLGYTHLLYTFNHNLFLLVLSERRSIAIVCKRITESVELNMQQISLLSTIRKHSILGCFLVFSNLFFGAYSFCDNTNLLVSATVLHIFVMAGPFCIYLGFKENENLYEKCFNLCDRKCERICIALAEKRLCRQHQEIVMSNIVSTEL